MRSYIVPILSLMLLILPHAVEAQKQNNIWYFGYKAGIDFNTSPPTPLGDGVINTREGCAAVSDATTGALLFYTDGVTVWNRIHRPMPGGIALFGGVSSTQSAVIVPQPGHPEIYYIFTAAQYEGGRFRTEGYRYSIVDMRKDSGRGDVVTKNAELLAPGTEKLTAVSACNGADVWIITRKSDTDKFHTYRLTSAGLSLQPVLSSAGPVLSDSLAVVGYLQASPDGRRLAMAGRETTDPLQLYDFDPATGQISNPLTLATDDLYYGACFSPDNSKLYATSVSGVIQFDLSSNQPAQILASRVVLLTRNETVFGIQNGPDGRIYVAARNSLLDVIMQPNARGTACGYTRSGYSASEPGWITYADLGLPHPVVTLSAPADPEPDLKVDRDTTICAGDAVRLTASTSLNCFWSPPDGLSCTNCSGPFASPDTTTTYMVRTVGGSCLGEPDTTYVTVTVKPKPVAAIAPVDTLCLGASARLVASGGVRYSWKPYADLSCADCPDPLASPPVTTLYHVVGRDPRGCVGEDSVLVVVGRAPTVDAGRDTIICTGGIALLRGVADVESVSWSPSEGLDCPTCPTTQARPSAATRYILTAIDKDGCIATDSVDVIVGRGDIIVRAAVDRGGKVIPASAVTVPVRLLDPVDQASADKIRISVTFDPRVVRVDDIDLRSSLLEGWNIDERIIDSIQGRLSARFTAPSGRTLKGDGILLYLHLRGYIGNADSSELGLEVELPGNECLAVHSSPGLIRIDSICGLSLRLIEGNAEGYALEPNRPNPFNPTTELEFSLGLDGATKLEIRDAGGRLTALLVDEMMEAGKYIVTWDAADQASGVYYYRLTSGTWSRTGSMTLVK